MLLVCLLSWLINLSCRGKKGTRSWKGEYAKRRGGISSVEAPFLHISPFIARGHFHTCWRISFVSLSNDKLEFCFHKSKYGKNSSELTDARLLLIYAFWGGCPLTTMSRLRLKPLSTNENYWNPTSFRPSLVYLWYSHWSMYIDLDKVTFCVKISSVLIISEKNTKKIINPLCTR